MRKFKARLILLIFFGICCGASAQITRSNGTYLFRLKFAKGEKFHFLAPTSVTGLTPKPFHMQLDFYLRVLKVKGGRNTLKGTLKTQHTGSLGGQVNSAIFQVDSLGRVTGTNTGLSGMVVVYPKHALKLGESFKSPVASFTGSSSELPSKSPPNLTTQLASFTFKGWSTYNHVICALITFRSSKSSDARGYMLISSKDGLAEKYVTTFVLNFEASKVIRIRSTIVRQTR